MALNIPLDRLNMATRDDNSWTLSRKDAHGVYRPFESWIGNRHTLDRRLRELGVTPSRQAEDMLAAIPERTAFAEDVPLKVIA